MEKMYLNKEIKVIIKFKDMSQFTNNFNQIWKLMNQFINLNLIKTDLQSKKNKSQFQKCNSIIQIKKESKEANKKLKIYSVLKLILMHSCYKNQSD